MFCSWVMLSFARGALYAFWPLTQELRSSQLDARPRGPAVCIRAGQGHHVVVVILAEEQETNVEGLPDFEVVRAAAAARKIALFDLPEDSPLLAFGQPPSLLCETHGPRSEEHTSELQSHSDLVCRLLLEKKKKSY